MYKCNNCEEVFKEPLKVSAELFYGVASEFNYSCGEKVEICPYCENNDFKPYREDFEENSINYQEKEKSCCNELKI